MKGEFYKMEYEAWDEGTEELTMEQMGCYLAFCHQMYRRRGTIQNRLPSLARLWRCHPNKARTLLGQLVDAGKIEVTPDGHLTNTRVRRELDARDTQRTQRSHSGKTGGTQSGQNRRKSLESLGGGEAFASTPSNEIEPEERREEESRGESEEKRGEKGKSAAAPPPAVPDAPFDKWDDGYEDPVETETAATPEPPQPVKPQKPVDPSILANSHFEDFWKLYPIKDGKKYSREIWERLAKAKKTKIEDVMSGITRYAAKRDDRPWKNCSTWLNGEHWNDEGPTQPVNAAKPSMTNTSGIGFAL